MGVYFHSDNGKNPAKLVSKWNIVRYVSYAHVQEMYDASLCMVIVLISASTRGPDNITSPLP